MSDSCLYFQNSHKPLSLFSWCFGSEVGSVLDGNISNQDLFLITGPAVHPFSHLQYFRPRDQIFPWNQIFPAPVWGFCSIFWWFILNVPVGLRNGSSSGSRGTWGWTAQTWATEAAVPPLPSSRNAAFVFSNPRLTWKVKVTRWMFSWGELSRRDAVSRCRRQPWNVETSHSTLERPWRRPQTATGAPLQCVQEWSSEGKFSNQTAQTWDRIHFHQKQTASVKKHFKSLSFREIDEENPENMRIEDKYWRKLSVKWSTVPEPEPPCSSRTTGSSGLEIEMGSPWSRTDGAAGTRFRPLPQLPSILHFRQQQLRSAWWWRRERPLRRWSNWSGWGSWGKAFFWTCKGETWSCLPARQVEPSNEGSSHS